MKDLSNETRALIAAGLSLIVITLWIIFLKPPMPPPRPQPAAPLPAESQGQTSPPESAAQGAPAKAPAQPATVTARAASLEKTIVVESPLYRVELSNRGGVVQSWQLKKYKDDSNPPKTLDLVHLDTARQYGWPLSIALDDAQLQTAANSGLYEITPSQGTVQAPAEINVEWSDGHLAVSKRLKFGSGYLIEVHTAVSMDGKPLSHGVAWLGGFGDATAYHAAQQVQIFFSSAGKFEYLAANKVGTPGAPAQPLKRPGAFDYAGIEDRYFIAAFLPQNPGAGYLTLTDWALQRDIVVDNKPAKEPLVEMSAGSTVAGPQDMRLFVGPKDFDELKRINPPLKDVVQFGWLELIALPLFYLLRWLHTFVPNYGWAIVLLTVLLNMALYPLKIKSWRSMQRMQKVAPQVKAIQERYKKYSMRDPRKQEMNKEIMELYGREGVNPMGGCLIMLPQMPIWFGLYRMLGITIELRHAKWIWWIRDLSAPDPYYLLPIVMGITWYLVQKMTPVTTTDPAQQRMMNLMPIMFAGMFIIFPVSSGLVLYILSSNLVNMAQQWHLNRGVRGEAKPGRGKGSKRN